jgi:WD40 repeat protein
MESARKCLECGLPLPDAEDGNHCPNCLFRLAFTPQVEGADELAEPTARPASQPRYFAGYELVSEIAFGGMGVVWKARQLGVNRLVALKMIPAGHLASPQMRLRFRVEIETVAQLDHPHIVPLYETGEHDGQHYFSMKLLEGGNLGEWIARHRSDGKPGEDERKYLREAVRLLITIARAVHHAHQRGVLHRDLKPSNILLDQQGEPHVADFGLAKVLGRDSGLTFTESALGSPNYMAPEQASGHSTQLSVAADMYGLGAILYELLTGQPPFQASTAVETMRRVVDDEVTSPRQLNPVIDADLETICLKCLQKQPMSRYDSADALAADLERWLAGQPIHARPVGPVEQFARWCRRQPGLATALGLSLLLLLVVVVGTVIAGVRIARAERKATAHLRESLLGQVRILRFNSDLGQRDEGLRLIREAAALGGPPEYRQQLRNELLALLARTEVSFVPQPHLLCSPDPSLNLLSPQGNRFATVTNRHTVLVLDAPDGREVTRFNVGDSPISALERFSHDGRYLGLRQADGVSIWDTDTGLLCFTTNRANLVFSFVHDGSGVIMQTGRKSGVICELPSLRVIRPLAPYAGETVRTSWSALLPSPDGRLLAAIRRSSRIVELIDLETGKFRRNLINEGRAAIVRWSGDSTRLGVATTARRVALWNVRSGGQSYLSNVLPALPHTLALNETGTLLAAAGEDRVVRFFNGQSPRPVFELLGESANLSFDASGTRLQPVFRNATAGFIHLQRPPAYFESVVADTDAGQPGCYFSADGQIAAVGTATNVALCTAAEGAVLTNLTWSINSTCFDPREPAVMAAGVPGMFRWALQRSATSEFRLANERRVIKGPGWRSFTYSAGGECFVAANVYSNTAFVFDRTLTNRLFEVGPHPGLEFVTISPDARWVATGSDLDRQLRLWDTKNNLEVLTLPGGVRPKAAFSPDGKWFAAFGVGFELREVVSWKRVPLFHDHEGAPVLGAAAFSPDGRTLAVVTDVRAVHLIDLRSLQILGLLRPPGATEIHALAFSPDSTRLAAVGDAVRLRIWNLPALQQRLTEFELDWQPPRRD